MNKITWVLVLLLVLVVPVSLQAAVFKSGDVVSLDEDSPDDVFISGSTVDIDKEVAGDIFAAGQSITVSSSAQEDVYAAGRTIRITAPVQQDVLAAGESISISGSAVDGVMAAGNMIEISPTTTVNGNVYVAGQTVDLAGTITGSVYATGETIRVKAGTVIEGDLNTYGPEPVVEETAVIRGQRHHQAETHEERTTSSRSLILGWLRSVISWFILSLLFLYLLPTLARTVVATALGTSGRSLAIGALWLLACIPAVLLLFITILGIPLAFTVAFLTLAFIIMTMAYMPLVIGSWTMSRLSANQAATMTWQHVLLGVVLMEILWIVPIVGQLVGLVLFILTLGALLLTIWRNLRGETIDTPVALS